MKCKADNVNPMQLLEFYKNENKELGYNLMVEKMVVTQYRNLIDELIANHPELEKEVTNGSNSTPVDTGREQKH